MKKGRLSVLLASICLVLIVAALPFIAACAAPTPTAEEVVVGVPIALGYRDGITAERGITRAGYEINAAGGIDVGGVKHLIKLEIMDDRDLEPGVPVSEALLVVEKLILEKNANFIVGGPIRSEAALGVMGLLSEHQTISILSAGVLSPAYEGTIAGDYDKYKYCFRTTGNVVPMVGEIVDTLESIKADKGWDKIYIMVQDVAHARASGDAIKGSLESKGGWDIAGYDVYPTGSTDFSIGLLKAKKAGAQFLFIWFDMPEASILMKQWYDMELPSLPLGYIHALKDAASWDATGGKCAYSVCVYAKAGCVATPAIPWSSKFIDAHKAKFGTEPENEWCSTSYTVLYILKDAIERAGSLDSDAVIPALEQPDMMGTYGRVRFDPQSHQIVYSTDPAEGAVGLWAQWLDGKRVAVFPTAIATQPLALPPWME